MLLRTYKDRCLIVIPPFQILIQLLYNVMARGERRHTNVRIVGWRAALLRRGEQATDKERTLGMLGVIHVS